MILPLQYKLAPDRNRVLAAILLSGDQGATCDELEQVADLTHQTASARLSELRSCGMVFQKQNASGDFVRRFTRTGSTARVYVAAL